MKSFLYHFAFIFIVTCSIDLYKYSVDALVSCTGRPTVLFLVKSAALLSACTLPAAFIKLFALLSACTLPALPAAFIK